MSLKITPVIDRNMFEKGRYSPKFIPADTSTDVVDDITRSTVQGTSQIVTRELFNAGPTAVYYCYGKDCKPPTANPAANAGDWNGQIASGQMLVLETMQRVSVYAVGGAATIGITQIERDDAVQPAGGLTQNINP